MNLPPLPGSAAVRPLVPADYRHVVVFFANALGDQILALPALRSLSALFEGRFTLLTVHGPVSLIFGDVARERTVGIAISLEGEFDVASAADAVGQADLIVCPQTWHSASVEALVGRLAPTRSVGLAPLFDTCLPMDPARHQVDQMYEVCRLFGEHRPAEAHARPFGLPDASVDLVRALRASLDGRPWLVLHPETKPDKQWTAEGWNRALDLFLAAHPQYAVLAIARHESSLRGLTPRLIPLAGLPLASAAAIVAAADLFAGVDSFPLHVADIWRVPGVGLFGPSSSREYGFRFSPHAAHVEGRGSMGGIAPEAVAAALAGVARAAAGAPRAYEIGSLPAPVVTLRYR